MAGDKRVVVIGLGYVGLPLAIALAKSVETWGLDVDTGRIAELERGHDRTGEIEPGRRSVGRGGHAPILGRRPC